MSVRDTKDHASSKFSWWYFPLETTNLSSYEHFFCFIWQRNQIVDKSPIEISLVRSMIDGIANDEIFSSPAGWGISRRSWTSVCCASSFYLRIHSFTSTSESFSPVKRFSSFNLRSERSLTTFLFCLVRYRDTTGRTTSDIRSVHWPTPISKGENQSKRVDQGQILLG